MDNAPSEAKEVVKVTQGSDLIERLREAAANERVYAQEQDFWHEEILTEASDEITALRDRVAALEGALRPFADYRGSDEFLKSAEDCGICAGASFTAGQYRAARALLANRGGANG